jgi:hypothetical protein
MPSSGTQGPEQTQSQSGNQNQLHPLQRNPQTPFDAQQQQQPQFLGSGGSKTEGGSVPGGSLVALTAEERRKIREIILAENVAQEPRPAFKLQVGAKLPENVSLNPIPPKVLEIQPRYKDFGFVIANDRIVIVQRGTREIDTMIPI